MKKGKKKLWKYKDCWWNWNHQKDRTLKGPKPKEHMSSLYRRELLTDRRNKQHNIKLVIRCLPCYLYFSVTNVLMQIAVGIITISKSTPIDHDSSRSSRRRLIDLLKGLWSYRWSSSDQPFDVQFLKGRWFCQHELHKINFTFLSCKAFNLNAFEMTKNPTTSCPNSSGK